MVSEANGIGAGHRLYHWRHHVISVHEAGGAEAGLELLGHAVGRRPHSLSGLMQMVSEVGDSQSVSPTLQCVTALMILFFSVFILIVAVRFARTFVARRVEVDAIDLLVCESALIEATESLTPAPMLCILLAAARLRAIQLDPHRGDPQHWAQICMYMGTGAFFCRFFMDLAYGARGTEASKMFYKVVLVTRSLASALVYSSCVAIVISMLVMGAPSQADAAPFRMTTWCVVVLTIAYFAEHLTLEAAIVATTWNGELEESDAARALVEGTQPAADMEEKAIPLSGLAPRSASGFIRNIARGGEMEVETAALQFPTMLCVLLVGIELRSVQLGLSPPAWALWAMLLSVAAVVVQAVLAGVNVLRGVAMGLRPLQEVPGFIGYWVGVAQLVLIVTLCLGTAFTLGSVFAMEKRPLGML